MPRTSSDALVSSIDVFKTETNPSTDLGQIVSTQDGRKFRYTLVGASALVGGNLEQGRAVDTQFDEMTVTVGAPIGVNTLTATNGTTTIAANDFKDGIGAITSSTGIGQYSRILTHTTGASGAPITWTFEDAFQVAVTTSSKFTVRWNPWFKVVQAANTVTSAAVGGAVNAAAAGVYCFIQTGGMGVALSDSTVTAASTMGLSPSAGTAGAVTKHVNQDQYLGRSLVPVNVSAKTFPVLWQLD